MPSSVTVIRYQSPLARTLETGAVTFALPGAPFQDRSTSLFNTAPRTRGSSVEARPPAGTPKVTSRRSRVYLRATLRDASYWTGATFTLPMVTDRDRAGGNSSATLDGSRA